MQKVNEFVFHNGDELKKEMDKVEIELENKFKIMHLNYMFLMGNVEIIGDEIVQSDADGNVISKIDCNKIVSFKIYSDKTEPHVDLEDYDTCYSFINYKLQFLDDEDRDNFGYDLLKNSDDDDDFFLNEELLDAFTAHVEQGTGVLAIPKDLVESELNNLEGISPKEKFIKLLQLKLKSNKKSKPKDI